MSDQSEYRVPRPCPEGTDPKVVLLDGLMRAHRMAQKTLAEEAGVSDSTIGSWRLRLTEPGITTFNRCLNVFGYELAIVRRLTKEDGNGST